MNWTRGPSAAGSRGPTTLPRPNQYLQGRHEQFAVIVQRLDVTAETVGILSSRIRRRLGSFAAANKRCACRNWIRVSVALCTMRTGTCTLGIRSRESNRMLAIHLIGRYGYASWAASGMEVKAPNSTSAATCSLASRTAGPDPANAPR